MPVYLVQIHPALRLGMSARVCIPVGVATNVLYLPAHAVQTGPEGNFEFVEDGEDLQRRTVRTGVSDGVMVEITEGLEEGETIVAPIWGPGLYRGG